MKKYIIILLLALLARTPAYAQQESNRTDSLRHYLFQLVSSATAEDKLLLDEQLAMLEKSDNEKDLILAIAVLDRAGRKEDAEKITAAAIVRFPAGRAAMNKEYKVILETAGSTEKLKVYNKWIKTFPEAAENPHPYYDFARVDLATVYAEEKNAKNMLYWIDQIKSPAYRKMIAGSFARKSAAAGDWISAEKLFRQALDTPAPVQDSGKLSQHDREYYQLAADFSRTLLGRDKPTEALKWATMAYNVAPMQQSPSVAESYALALSANGQCEQALPVFSHLLKEGGAGKASKTAFRQCYIRMNGTSQGYDSVLVKLTRELKASEKKKLAARMITENAPDFELTDLNGKKVSLQALRGKVVILDFWATWCAPCKASFPAMQQAIDTLKGNSDVVFLFIDTWERMEDPKLVIRKFLTDNKYDFRVLLDSQKSVVMKYGISSIPSKFVIDKEGKIRFKITGAGVGDDATVEEITTMVELSGQ